MMKLFVVGFPRTMDEMALAQLFATYGDIRLLTIIRDKFSGESKGHGFIQMDDRGEQAIAGLNGLDMGDRKLEVRIAEDKTEPVQKPFVKPNPVYVPVSANPVKKKRPRLSR